MSVFVCACAVRTLVVSYAFICAFWLIAVRLRDKSGLLRMLRKMSGQIFGNPALLDDVLVPISKASNFFQSRPSRQTLERWLRKGINGVKLESVKIGLKRFVTERSIREFLVAQNSPLPEPTSPVKRSMSEKELKACRKKYKLPTPIEN